MFALAKMFLKSGTGDSAILDAMFENSNLCDDVNVLTLNFISEKNPTKVFILTTNETTEGSIKSEGYNRKYWKCASFVEWAL